MIIGIKILYMNILIVCKHMIILVYFYIRILLQYLIGLFYDYENYMNISYHYFCLVYLILLIRFSEPSSAFCAKRLRIHALLTDRVDPLRNLDFERPHSLENRPPFGTFPRV